MPLNTLRHTGEYQILADTIKKAASKKKVFYAQNWGNWGDGLIHRGTIQFFEAYGIEYLTLPRADVLSIRSAFGETGLKLKDAILIAGGGGAWCELWPGSRSFLESCADLFEHVVVLPTTYELPPLDSEQITYFRRDQHESKINLPKSIFCHDMAFFLNEEIPEIDQTAPVGNFFREDKERSDQSINQYNNIDIIPTAR